MSGWISWLVAGLVSLLGGIFALANPMAATLTAELLTGYLFIAVAVLMLLSVFQDDSWGSRALSIVLGLFILFVGVNLVANPLQGMVSLTFLVAISMLIIGVFRILLAFGVSQGSVRIALIVAGVISLLLGAMILANFPQSAAVVLGILLAVELISNGVSLLAIAFAVKSARQ